MQPVMPHRLLLKDPAGGGGGEGVVWGLGQPIRKILLRQKMKFIKGAGNLIFFWALTSPPPFLK